MGGPDADVVVVGGGAAGLAGAAAMARAGLRVVLLEARDRLGGRIDTRREPGWPVPIEAGAEFLHGTARELHALVPGVRGAREIPPRHHLATARGLREADDLFARATELIPKLPVGSKPRSYDAAVRGRAMDRRLREVARSYVEGFNAADASRISMRSLVDQAHASDAVEGDRLFRVPRGYDGVVARLARRCDRAGVTTHVSRVVTAIEWARGSVRVHARGPLGANRPIAARAALVTIPLGVLQAPRGQTGAIAFRPALPADKRAAIRALAMGAVTKLLLRFRALPAPLDRDDVVFVHAPRAIPATWWTLRPVDAPVVVGWVGGPAAERMSRLSAEAQLERGMATLARTIGNARAGELLASFRIYDWRRDPFARGAYTWIPSGAEGAASALAEPIDDTLHFAGEATDVEGHMGTVHGALRTGAREAARIIAAL